MTQQLFFQQTLATSASCVGVGVHTGRRVRLTIRPSAANTGLVFVRTDLAGADTRIAVSAQAVTRTQLNTEVSNLAGVSVSTIEHLMAALAALQVDNAVLEVDGPEVPIMDGSSAPFVQLIDRAGRRSQGAPRRYIEVLAAVEISNGGKSAVLSPCPRFEVACEIAFDSAAVGRQSVDFAVTEESFRREFAAARTFGFLKDVEALQRMGLARGASLDNAIALDGNGIVNAGPLRFPDEFVRHKALDAIGDLYVLGAPVLGRLQSRFGGHGLNNALARSLLADRSAWRMKTFVPELAEAV